jgi:hypothetical protein
MVLNGSHCKWEKTLLFLFVFVFGTVLAWEKTETG